ncbi:unnamed protein product [Paramecium sonneborni]|uniref:Uncharacterized protein n=1 Tax=Paramecium sonneborni TaxID=65129 RepID=A0A8S1L9C1_9CILI|nr:unnamed protein product [Paramecium sonneborni]
MMLEIPMINKLNTKIEPTFDCTSSKLYDKGENIYIPLDGRLTTDQFTFLPNQAFTQMGLCQQSLYALKKESYNHRVLIIKVNNIWPHLDYEIKEDFKYLQLITQNKLLNKYSTLPTFLFQYLDRIIVLNKQIVNIENSILFIADGIMFQNGRQVINHFEGEAVAITECRLYGLKKSRYLIFDFIW